ncbi:DivIVA domain-containing protein [Gordonia sp. NPDC003376]
MQTILLYLLIMAVVVAVVFALVWFVFGRGEELPPLDDATTLTRLPRSSIYGYDVRALRFASTLRGYKQSEVDWALSRLADEIDDLRALVQQLQDRDALLTATAPAGGVDDTAQMGRHEAPENSPQAGVDRPADAGSAQAGDTGGPTDGGDVPPGDTRPDGPSRTDRDASDD